LTVLGPSEVQAQSSEKWIRTAHSYREKPPHQAWGFHLALSEPQICVRARLDPAEYKQPYQKSNILFKKIFPKKQRANTTKHGETKEIPLSSVEQIYLLLGS
jgi:hypothetical protein